MLLNGIEGLPIADSGAKSIVAPSKFAIPSSILRSNMDYVNFRSFDNYIYANILLLRLKGEGIDCYLKDENTVTIDPLLSPALGGIKVMVAEEEVQKANSILEAFEEEYVKTLACPDCHQKTFQRIIKKRRPNTFLSGLLSSLIYGSLNSDTVIYRCLNCGYKTTDLASIPQEDI